MVYSFTHLYVTFHWQDQRSPEFGQVGLRWALENALPSETDMDAIAGAFGIFWGNEFTNISDDLQFTHAKFALIDPDGKYPADFEPYVADVSPVPGGEIGTARFPLSTACAASLTTPKARGRAHRGRIYLPPIEDALGGGGMWGSSIVQSRANQVASMISSINTIIGSSAYVMSKVGAGYQEVITGVAVGSRPDVMRSRSRGQAETYAEAAV